MQPPNAPAKISVPEEPAHFSKWLGQAEEEGFPARWGGRILWILKAK